MLAEISKHLAAYGVWIQLVVLILGALLGSQAAPVVVNFVFEGDQRIELRGERIVARRPVPPITSGIRKIVDPRSGDHLATAYPTVLPDARGDVFVLSKSFRWALGTSADLVDVPAIEYMGQPVSEEEVLKHLRSEGIQNQMALATDLVAVGLASCEGNDETELVRSQRRADHLIHLLEKVKPPRPVHLLDLALGRYTGVCHRGGDTSDQRPVVFLALIRDEGAGPLEDKQLTEAMSRAVGLDIRPSQYAAH